jgi:hypothetical protein
VIAPPVIPILLTIFAAGWFLAVLVTGVSLSPVLAAICGLMIGAVLWMWIEWARSR